MRANKKRSASKGDYTYRRPKIAYISFAFRGDLNFLCAITNYPFVE